MFLHQLCHTNFSIKEGCSLVKLVLRLLNHRYIRVSQFVRFWAKWSKKLLQWNWKILHNCKILLLRYEFSLIFRMLWHMATIFFTSSDFSYQTLTCCNRKFGNGVCLISHSELIISKAIRSMRKIFVLRHALG